MSLGRRIAKRGRAAVIASLASVPREPLSFLYPPWPQGLTFSTTTKDQDDFKRVNLHSSWKRLSFISPKNVLFADLQSPTIEVKQKAEGQTTSSWRPPLQDEGFHRLSEAGVARILRRKLAYQKHALNKHRHRLDYQSKKRDQYMEWDPDWRTILGLLCESIPLEDKWLEDAVEIFAPEHAVEQLLYGVDNNIWEISARNDSSISLGGYDPSTKEYQRFFISGTESSVRRTTAQISAMVSRSAPNSLAKRETIGHWPISVKATRVVALNDSTKDPKEVLHLGAYDGTPRYVLNTWKYDRLQPTSPDKAPEPEVINQITVYDYIWRITTTFIPNHLHSQIYTKDTGLNDKYERIDKIKEVLRDPKYRHALSRAAFNTAMDYCIQANQIPTVKFLLSLMEKRHIPANVDTFNIMLGGTAKQEDLYNYNFILRIMLKRGIKPNGKTWAILMGTIPDIRIKLYILQEMKERGLLQPHVNIKRVAEELCPAEIEHSLDQDESTDDFIGKMDERYTPYWLTTKSGNQILHALGSRGLISRCWEFLYIMRDRSIRIDSHCVNTVLTHCKVMRNINGLLEVFRRAPHFFPGQERFIPNHITYDVLFEAAWRGRRYNLAKVIWRYACMDGGTTRDMRLRVYSSFQCAALAHDENNEIRRMPWYRSAGFFILNAHPDHIHPALITRSRQDLYGSLKNFVESLIEFRNQATERFAGTEKFYLKRLLKMRDKTAALKEASEIEEIPYDEDVPELHKDKEAEIIESQVESELDESHGMLSPDAIESTTSELSQALNELSGMTSGDAKESSDISELSELSELSQVLGESYGIVVSKVSRRPSNTPNVSQTLDESSGIIAGNSNESSTTSTLSPTTEPVLTTLSEPFPDSEQVENPKMEEPAPELRRFTKGIAATTWPRNWTYEKHSEQILKLWYKMMGMCKRNEHFVFQNWQPARPFSDMLVEAWERDQEWERLMNESLTAEARTMKWKLQNAIEVPIKSKDPYVGLQYVWK